MTPDKQRIHNYSRTGLKHFLETSIDEQSSLKRTVNPKGSTAFYVVRLLIKPASGWQTAKRDSNIRRNSDYGTTRAGFSLKGQNIFYTLNGKEIQCGSINLKNLTLKHTLLNIH